MDIKAKLQLSEMLPAYNNEHLDIAGTSLVCPFSAVIPEMSKTKSMALWSLNCRQVSYVHYGTYQVVT